MAFQWQPDGISGLWRFFASAGVRLYGAVSGYVGFKPASAAGSTDYTLPSSPAASNGLPLQCTTTGVLTFGAIAESAVTNLTSDLSTLAAAIAGKQAAGSYITSLTGDVTASGPGAAAATLATVNSNVGSVGGTTAIPVITVNAKGLVTAASTAVVVAPAGTLTGTALASGVVTSSLTTVGTIGTGAWQGTKVGLAYGGTNADLSATGGTSKVLQQASVGAAITVGQLAASDLSNGASGSGAVALVGSPTFTGTITGAIATLSGQLTVSAAGAASTPPLLLSGSIFTGGTTATTQPQLLIQPSAASAAAWSTTGTAFGINVTSAIANFIDCHNNGGTAGFTVTSAGALTANSIASGSQVQAAAASPFVWGSRSKMLSPSDGTINMTANDGTTAATVTVKTQTAGDNTTNAASTAFVATATANHYPDGVFYFADGSDGAASLDGTVAAPSWATKSGSVYTMTRHAYCTNLTLTSTAQINTAGYRIFCSGTLDISNAQSGAIVLNGANANNGAAGGAGGIQGSTAGGMVLSMAPGQAGGAGGTGAGTGAAGSTGTTLCVGGTAGNSGAGGLGASGAGGAGLTATVPSVIEIRRYFTKEFVGVSQTSTNASVALAAVSARSYGGGGGGGDSSVSGGGGGAGGNHGGVIWISALVIARGSNVNTAIFQAKGSAGGNGGSPASGNAGGGGGGTGGCGGFIYIAYGSLTGSTIANALDASGGGGGTGGTKQGTGVNGTAGGQGSSGRMCLVNIGSNTYSEAAPVNGSNATTSANTSQMAL